MLRGVGIRAPNKILQTWPNRCPYKTDKAQKLKLMKGIIATAAALVVATGMAMASKNTNKATKASQVKILQTEAAGIYNLRFAAESAGQVTVKITSQQGNVLLKEKIAYKNAFERPYNLQNLPDGTYTISVEKDGTVLEERIHHVKNLPLKKSAYNIDVNEVGDHKYELVVKKEGHQAVKVKISDKNGFIYFNDVIDQQGSFSQVFDLSNVLASGLTMEVSVNNNKTVEVL